MSEEVSVGEMPNSEPRYMPSPAGLMPIDERSAPSDVKAPPSAALRAVENE